LTTRSQVCVPRHSFTTIPQRPREKNTLYLHPLVRSHYMCLLHWRSAQNRAIIPQSLTKSFSSISPLPRRLKGTIPPPLMVCTLTTLFRVSFSLALPLYSEAHATMVKVTTTYQDHLCKWDPAFAKDNGRVYISRFLAGLRSRSFFHPVRAFSLPPLLWTPFSPPNIPELGPSPFSFPPKQSWLDSKMLGGGAE